MAKDALGFEIVEEPAQPATAALDPMGFEIVDSGKYDELGFEIVPEPFAKKLAATVAATADKTVSTVGKSAFALIQGIVESGVGAGKALARMSDPGPANKFWKHERAMELAGELQTTPEKAGTLIELERDLRRSQATAPGEAFSQGAKEAAEEFKQLRDQTPGYEAPAKGAELVGGMLPFVAEATIPVVGQAAAIAHGGMSTGGDVWQQAYDYYRKEGLSEEEATKRADELGGKAGAANAALFTALPGPGAKAAEALVGERLANRPVAQALVRTGMSGTQAGAVMAADKAQQLLEAKDSYRPELTMDEAAKEIGETFISGMAAGVVIHGPQEIAKLGTPDGTGTKGEPPLPPQKPQPKTPAAPPSERVPVTDSLLQDMRAGIEANRLKPEPNATEGTKATDAADAVKSEAVDQAVAIEAKDHPAIAESNPEILPQIVADELKADPKAYAKELSPEDQAKLEADLTADKSAADVAEDWIREQQQKAARAPLGGSSPDAALKVVSEWIRKGETPEGPISGDLKQALMQSLRPTRDAETGETLDISHPDWPRTGTLINFLESRAVDRMPDAAEEVKAAAVDKSAEEIARRPEPPQEEVAQNVVPVAQSGDSGAQNEVSVAQTTVGKPKASRSGRFLLKPRSDGVPDILDAIQKLGGMQPPDAKIWGNWRDKVRGPARLLIRRGGETADNLVDALNGKKAGTGGRNRQGAALEEQIFRIETPDDLFEAIDQAVGERERLKAERGGPEAQEERFWKAATDPANKSGLRKVNSQELHVGDRFRLRYPGANHEEFEVRHIDPDTGEVQIKDGPMFGTRDLPDGAEIWVVAKTAEIGGRAGAAEFNPEGGLEAPRAQESRPEAKEEPEKGGFEGWLDRAIEATDPTKGGKLREGVLGAPVWVPEAAAHGVLLVMRAALRTGRKLSAAITQGVEWMRHHYQDKIEGWNEEELRTWLHGLAGREFPHESALAAEESVQALANRLTEIHQHINDLKRQGLKVIPDMRERLQQAKDAHYEARRELLAQPAYVELLLQRLEEARQQPHSEERAATLEHLQAELEEAPAALVNQVYAKVHPDREPEAPEQAPANPLPAAEARRRAEARLPEPMKPIFRWGNRMFEKLAAMYRAGPNRDRMAVLKDAADNTAMVFGRRAANGILHELNRAFGATTLAGIQVRSETREAALTMALEAGAGMTNVDRARVLYGLTRMREVILQSDARDSRWSKKALAAIQFAEEHLERLMPIAQEYARLTDAENLAENHAGYRTLYRRGGYVFHTQDVTEHSVFPEVSGGGGGAPAPFRHKRDHPTYADSIASGMSPQSLSAVDLLQRRITMGRRMINYGAWVESLRDLVDPSTRESAQGGAIVTEPDVRIREDGSEDITAPIGYFLANFGGKQVAVHKGYEGIFDALTAGSWFRKRASTQWLTEGLGLAKHLVLFFDTFHLGRLAFWNSAARRGLPTYERGLTLLDSTAADIQRMVENGEVPAEYGRQLAETKFQIDGLMREGLNVGGAGDNLRSHLVQKLPIAGPFNKWLFEQYQRGAMVEVALRELERLQKSRRDLSEVQMWRMTARAVNTRFGSLNSQSWIRSKTGQDLARIIFLAPQWNESLIRAELGAVRDAIGSAKALAHGRLEMGMLGRSVGTAAVGMFIANQILNYFTRGHPTWENPEEDDGAKLSAWIPDAMGGPGFFIHPMAVPAEITHLLWKNTEKTGSLNESLRRFLAGRLNTGSRPISVWWTKHDPLGRPLRQGEVLPAALDAALPIPISAGSIYRFGKQLVTGEHEEAFPGQFQKQAMQTFGIKSEAAPSAEQRMRALALEWRKEQPGYKENPEFFSGDYRDLLHALQMGNMRDAAAALDDLRGKKTERAIREYFHDYERHPYTGSRSKESQFLKTLNTEQRSTYEKARAERRALVERFRGLAQLHTASAVTD